MRALNTTPAIVTHAGAARLPRWALLALCVVYVAAGFLGRNAWKVEDMGSVGYMAELAWGTADWWHPTLIGTPSAQGALLPYWLGAWMLHFLPDGVFAHWLMRLPFACMLALAMASHWYGTYYLARSPKAQPVEFAFGGQASPVDYARSIADGGLLAFIACLGLAPMAHETSPELVQLGFTSLFFAGASALPFRPIRAYAAIAIGMLGLSLSGAPTLSLVFGLGVAGFEIYQVAKATATTEQRRSSAIGIGVLLISSGTCATLASVLDLWRWKLHGPLHLASSWQGYSELLLWFTWPAWPLALWTLWVWRRQMWRMSISRHLALPLWLLVVVLIATWCLDASDRVLLLGLPAVASLAAFALPTLKRQVASLVDWFTLLFFTGWGLVLWVHFIAMHFGIPANPAANIARLAPGFQAEVSWFAVVIAAFATVAWAQVVHWRVGRHRRELWRSLVLPALGIAWCWTLMMTVGISLFDYTQSYDRWAASVASKISDSSCIRTEKLDIGQLAALRWIAKLPVQDASKGTSCPWMIIAPGPGLSLPASSDFQEWTPKALVNHPTDSSIAVWVMQRK